MVRRLRYVSIVLLQEVFSISFLFSFHPLSYFRRLFASDTLGIPPETNSNRIYLIHFKYCLLCLHTNLTFPLCLVRWYHCPFHSLDFYSLIILYACFFVLHFISYFSIQIPMGFAHDIAIRATFECVYINPHSIPFSCNADTGRLCGMYISIDALYIFHFEYRSYLISDCQSLFGGGHTQNIYITHKQLP